MKRTITTIGTISLLTLCTTMFSTTTGLPAWATPEQAEAQTGQRPEQQAKQQSALFPPPGVLVPDGLQSEDVELRPLLYWRAWANLKLPLARVISFLIFALTIINFSVPRTIVTSIGQYRKKWLRSFGIGAIFFTMGLIAAGGLVRMGLFRPLGTLTLAIVQLASLVGLTVAARSIGERTLRLMRLESMIKRAWLKSLCELWIGILIMSALSLIPGFGRIPRIGNRMLALLAAAGTGAFFSSLRMAQKPQDQTPVL